MSEFRIYDALINFYIIESQRKLEPKCEMVMLRLENYIVMTNSFDNSKNVYIKKVLKHSIKYKICCSFKCVLTRLI